MSEEKEEVEKEVKKEKKIPRPKPLTKKQKRVRDYMVKHPDATLKEIGKAAGLSKKYPASSASAIVNGSQNFKRQLQEAILKHPQLKHEEFLKTLAEGLKATKKTYASSKGKFTDEKEDADHMARANFSNLYAKIMDVGEKLEVEGKLEHTRGPDFVKEMTKEELKDFIRASKEAREKKDREDAGEVIEGEAVIEEPSGQETKEDGA